jgi:hypothetical protein
MAIHNTVFVTRGRHFDHNIFSRQSRDKKILGKLA